MGRKRAEKSKFLFSGLEFNTKKKYNSREYCLSAIILFFHPAQYSVAEGAARARMEQSNRVRPRRRLPAGQMCIRDSDYPSIIKSEGYNRLPAWMRILPGSVVRIRPTAVTYANSSVPIPPCVRRQDYTVLKVCGRTALLSCIHSWVRLEDLQLVQGPAV